MQADDANHKSAGAVVAATFLVDDVKITMTQSLWVAWATIAEVHAASARTAREGDADDRTFIEFCDGVVAITAVAMACEALQRRLQTEATVPAPTGKARAIDCLAAALHAALDLPEHQVDGLVETIKPYYDKRNSVAHFKEESREPVPHPTGGNTSVETFDFRVEEAENAVMALHAIFAALRDHPSTPFQAWSTNHRHVLPTT